MNTSPQHLYLELLKKTLGFTLWKEPPVKLGYYGYRRNIIKKYFVMIIQGVLKPLNLILAKEGKTSSYNREEGIGWSGYSDTMIGQKRLNNIQFCIETVLQDGIPGDFIETGVWRGGACIFMRGVLAAYGSKDRKVFLADSFEGLPKPDQEKYPADKGDMHYKHQYLAISQLEVENNFRKYDLLDDQVVFLKGWFKDTLPTAPIEKLAILRLDGDMYESTMDALKNLYHKLSPGGFCIIDDYKLTGCRAAIDDFRKKSNINSEILQIDESSSYWRKQ